MGQQDTNPFALPARAVSGSRRPGLRRARQAGRGSQHLRRPASSSTVFRDTPPLPFQTLRVHLFDGPRASRGHPGLLPQLRKHGVIHPVVGRAAGAALIELRAHLRARRKAPACQAQGPLPFTPSPAGGRRSTTRPARIQPVHADDRTRRRPAGAWRAYQRTLPEGLAAKTLVGHAVSGTARRAAMVMRGRQPARQGDDAAPASGAIPVTLTGPGLSDQRL